MKVIEIDPSGKIRLSRKEVLRAEEGVPTGDRKEEEPPRRVELGPRPGGEMPRGGEEKR